MDNYVHLSARQGGVGPGVNHFPTGGMKGIQEKRSVFEFIDILITRSALWIATFTMFIIWLIGLLLAPLAAKFMSGPDGKSGLVSWYLDRVSIAAVS